MKKHDVYAWYFPNWHADARNDEWHGEGWTEWEVVKCARARFPGHDQPKIPVWGYEDEADPAVMEKKITVAMDHGIDGFIYDTYWFEDGGYRMRAMEEGLFRAPSFPRFRFAVMWCNHDPIYAHPASPRYRHDPLLSGDVTVEGFLRLTDYFIANCFAKENYIRVDGKPYFIIWDLPKLVRNFGGLRGTRLILDDLRRRAKDAGVGDLYLATVIHMIPGFHDGSADVDAYCKALGIDGCVRYNWSITVPDFPAVPMSVYMENGVKTFASDAASCTLPVELTVSNGSDNSPRTVQSEIYRNLSYPYTAVVTERDPALYEAALRKAREFMESPAFRGHFLTLSTFNEWTEGNYLEPDTVFGYAWLDAVRRVFGEE